MANHHKLAVTPAKLSGALIFVFLLLYVLVEAGRLLILNSTIQSASLQAARYGSASGKGNANIPYFQDCDGIREAANRTNRSGTFDSIRIAYDNGIGTDTYNTCDGSVDTSILPSDNSRIVVTVSQEFKPLIPWLAPLLTRTITETSARTILNEVSISVTASPPTPQTTVIAASSMEQQFVKIDDALKQTLSASIAYNTPQSMQLDETTTISLLLNPSVSPENLATQVTESGQILANSIEVTPRMKAVLLSQEADAFAVQSIHDSPEQVISATETTQWSWDVTAKIEGTHRLTLVIYRLVTVDGQDYWRQVETYKSDIDVQVTLDQQLKQFDWKWIVGIVITALFIPAFWRWVDNRKKSAETVEIGKEKTKSRRKNINKK